MGCPSKSEMAIVGAGNVERVRIPEAFRIPVSGGHDRNDRLPFLDFLPTDLNIFASNSTCLLTRTFVAQQLLYSRGYQAVVGHETFFFLWIAKKGQNAVTNEVSGRFLATYHGDNRVRDHLLLRQPVAVDLRAEQGLNQTFLRGVSLFSDSGAE